MGSEESTLSRLSYDNHQGVIFNLTSQERKSRATVYQKPKRRNLSRKQKNT